VDEIDPLLSRLDDLIKEGHRLEGLCYQSRDVAGSSLPATESVNYSRWNMQSRVCLQGFDTISDAFTAQLESVKATYGPQGPIRVRTGILQAARDDYAKGYLRSRPQVPVIPIIENICTRFHAIARRLRDRYNGRPTLDITDEYDVQNLMHALLTEHFDDIRPEEPTPSYGGKSSRVDFLIKPQRVVVETKMTRRGLGAAEVSSELNDDIARYRTHPNCHTLVCFVYDPAALIANPRGLEADLSTPEGPVHVRVFVRPQ